VQLTTATRNDVMKMLTELQRPLSLTLEWTRVRNMRARSPTGEGIEQALHQSSNDVRANIDTLTSLLIELDRALEQLHTTERRYAEELKAKGSTMTLDKACLRGSLEAGAIDAIVVPTNLPPKLMHSAGMRTDNEWRNLTYASMSRGVVDIEFSKTLRKRIHNTIKGIEESGKTKRPAVVIDALQLRIKESSLQYTSLKYNAKMVSGELMGLDNHVATIGATLEKLQQQMHQAQHRLGLQVVRPAAESARTGVEEQLEIEVVNLKRTEANLKKQIKQLESKIVKNRQLLKKIDQETAHRVAELKMDEHCQSLQLPTLPQIASRYTHQPRKPQSSGRKPSRPSMNSTRNGVPRSPRGSPRKALTARF
jgi:hypothetical protein